MIPIEEENVDEMMTISRDNEPKVLIVIDLHLKSPLWELLRTDGRKEYLEEWIFGLDFIILIKEEPNFFEREELCIY